MQIFISHKETDVSAATDLVRLLEFSLALPQESIRCTSVPGYQLAFGKTIAEQLKEDLESSIFIFALLTKDSIQSNWVLFELGASWALGKLVVPVLGGELSYGDLPGPLASQSSIKIADKTAPGRLMDALNQIATFLNQPLKADGKVQSQLDKFVRTFRRKVQKKSAQTRRKGQSEKSDTFEQNNENIRTQINIQNNRNFNQS